MKWCLHSERRDQRSDTLSRFDPRYWTVDFPRPMMAAVVATAPDGLRVDAVFYRADDLAGLIWESADRHDHPLLRYDTVRDYRDCRLRFRWRSRGIKPLDAIHGPTLTIEGRDAAGRPRAWYVRLWNYATGTAEDAEVVIDFANLAGGFRFPEDRDPVWAGDVDRMFVSLVAPDYDAGARFLGQPQEGWVELTGIVCDGPGAAIGVGAAVLPEQGFGIASGYDDSYHLTPQRLLRNMLHLGYRGSIVHYVGMSHYFRLERSGDGLYASLTGDGATRRFALTRRYGDQSRRITRPVPGSVSVKVAGRSVTGFTVEPGGWLLFDAAPGVGAAITASFTFDVPVRFAEDRLSVTLAGFRAGAAASVPLVEVREA